MVLGSFNPAFLKLVESPFKDTNYAKDWEPRPSQSVTSRLPLSRLQLHRWDVESLFESTFELTFHKFGRVGKSKLKKRRGGGDINARGRKIPSQVAPPSRCFYERMKPCLPRCVTSQCAGATSHGIDERTSRSGLHTAAAEIDSCCVSVQACITASTSSGQHACLLLFRHGPGFIGSNKIEILGLNFF